MKFKFTYDDELDEKFTSDYNLEKHYTKHIKKEKEYNWTQEEYDKYTEELMKTPVNHKDIDGYVIDTEEGQRYCKYNTNNELFVIYRYDGNEPEAITSFKRPYRDYQGKKYTEYVDEIPNGK